MTQLTDAYLANKAELLKFEGDLKGAADLYQIMYEQQAMLPKVRTNAIKMNSTTLARLRWILPEDKPDPGIVKIDMFCGLQITVDESVPTGEVEFVQKTQRPTAEKPDTPAVGPS